MRQIELRQIEWRQIEWRQIKIRQIESGHGQNLIKHSCIVGT